ncbi:RidA family protein [Bordetella genomosp. 13]|uniref:RidA family protein n=1 Tax=Bordetella genomosp. 13 TaxID=463040 RepID=UPI00119D5A2F|nr:RidA family protein [Bordetella genomosp. 13]
MKILQPPDWMPPRGYSNGMLVEMTPGARLVFVGGQIGWNGQQQFETDDFALQVRQTLANIVAILDQGGARPEHIARMTWYVKDKREYVAAYPEIGKHYRELIGRHFPSMTAVEVADLVEDRAKVEIEVTAVVPAVLSGGDA